MVPFHPPVTRLLIFLTGSAQPTIFYHSGQGRTSQNSALECYTLRMDAGLESGMIIIVILFGFEKYKSYELPKLQDLSLLLLPEMTSQLWSP